MLHVDTWTEVLELKPLECARCARRHEGVRSMRVRAAAAFLAAEEGTHEWERREGLADGRAVDPQHVAIGRTRGPPERHRLLQRGWRAPRLGPRDCGGLRAARAVSGLCSVRRAVQGHDAPRVP